MGKFSRKANKGKNYSRWHATFDNTNAAKEGASRDSRQQRRAIRRKQALRQMKVQFPGEIRATRRILALDSLRKRKKGI